MRKRTTKSAAGRDSGPDSTWAHHGGEVRVGTRNAHDSHSSNDGCIPGTMLSALYAKVSFHTPMGTYDIETTSCSRFTDEETQVHRVM